MPPPAQARQCSTAMEWVLASGRVVIRQSWVDRSPVAAARVADAPAWLLWVSSWLCPCPCLWLVRPCHAPRRLYGVNVERVSQTPRGRRDGVVTPGVYPRVGGSKRQHRLDHPRREILKRKENER